MTTADDFTLYFDIEKDLTDGGDINWSRLSDAERREADAVLDDGTVIPEDLVGSARIELVELFWERIEAAADERGWDVARCDCFCDSQSQKINRLPNGEGDRITDELIDRTADLWQAIDDPTGVEILHATKAPEA